MRERDRYLKIVEWSEKDRCYVGTCPGLMIGGVHGRNETGVYQELCRVVDEWVKIYKKDGDPLPAATANKKYSGKFMLRMGQGLHKAIVIAALRHGVSLNTFCVKAVKEQLA